MYQTPANILRVNNTSHQHAYKPHEVLDNAYGTSFPRHPQWCQQNTSAATQGVFHDTDEDYLLPKLRQLGFHVSKGKGRRHLQARSEFERCLLSRPPLRDARNAPDEFKSQVFLVSPKPWYQVGDIVQFRIDLFDHYGNPRTSGGDEIRMRLVSMPGSASIAADVADMRNGSYLGTTLLPWMGRASVEVSVTYPREFLREAVRLRLSIHNTKWLAAEFQSGSVRERTGCLPSLPIPGYDTACNMTSNNGGMAFYCGHPTNKRLNCSHRKYFRVLPELWPLPMLKVEKQWIVQTFDRKPSLHLIPNNITISVQPDAPSPPKSSPTPPWPPTLPPCWKRTPESTWHSGSRTPQGWRDSNATWHSLTCALPARLHERHVRSCLQGTTLALVGDSNMRHWWYQLRGYLACSKEEVGKDGHQHKLCEVASSNTTLSWAFHGRPTFTAPDTDSAPLPKVLAELRHHIRHFHRRVILVLHYYLHFSSVSVSEYLSRVKAVKHHLVKFLREFPEAIVMIRGPHVIMDAMSDKGHMILGDLFGPAYTQIWHKEFEDLRENVYFLDFWDMTVATQNRPSHPPPAVLREMVKVMLSYVCEAIK